MKKSSISMLALLLISLVSQGQFNQEQHTLFGSQRGFGGYISVNTKLSNVNSQEALLVGGEAKFVLNHSFNIGVEGYGMTNNVKGNSYDDNGKRNNLELGYGGISMEPVIWSKSIIHFTTPILFGAGGIAEYSSDLYTIDSFEDENWDSKPSSSDFFLFVEPGINAEVNIFRMLRLAGGVSYKFVSDVQLDGLDRQSLEGYNVNVSLRFGWF